MYIVVCNDRLCCTVYYTYQSTPTLYPLLSHWLYKTPFTWYFLHTYQFVLTVEYDDNTFSDDVEYDDNTFSDDVEYDDNIPSDDED